MVSKADSVGYTIMGKTADWTVVQKTVTDTLHKEGKPQRVIGKDAGCSQTAVSKHIHRKLSGRKKCGRKRCTSNRDNRRLVKQRPFKNLGEIHREWTEAGVSASRATTHRRVQDMGYNCCIPGVKPLLNQRQPQKGVTWAKEKKDWTVNQLSKVLFSDESKFCISFGNQGPRVWRKSGEAQNPSCLKSSVKFPVSDDLWSHVICWCWSTVFYQVQSQRNRLPGHFRALHAYFHWQGLWRCWFHFPAGLGTCPHW